MAGKQLTSQNATITTVEVKLSTLTVSGKQVTLAVFRQLPEEPLIADDGTLNGVPWGHVNYHPDKCADNAPHWHVVWQRGEELLRSAVVKAPDLDGTRRKYYSCRGCFESYEADRFVNSQVREWLAGRASSDPLKEASGLSRLDQEQDIPCILHWIQDGVTVHAEPSAAAFAARTTSLESCLDDKQQSAEAPLRRWDITYLAPSAFPWPDETPTHLHAVLDAALDAAVEIRLKAGRELSIRANRENHETALAVRTLEDDVMAVLVKARGREHSSLEQAQKALREARAALDAEFEADGFTLEDVGLDLKNAIQEERARRQRHLDARKTLAELTQLYIAV